MKRPPYMIVKRREHMAPYDVYSVMVGTVKVYSQIGPISDKEAQYRVAEHARGKAVIEIKPAKPFSMTRGKTGPKPKGWQGWTQGEDA